MNEYLYHHTCKYSPDAYIKENAPFKSNISKIHGTKDKFNIPFLGEGYYFWEHNIDAAHTWGKEHYNNNYLIVEYKNLDRSKSFLDLCDSLHLEYFKKLKEDFSDESRNKFTLSEWIRFFRELSKKDKDFFPFNSLRSREDNDSDSFMIKRDKIFYSKKSPDYYTILSPLNIICIYDIKKATITLNQIIYKN